MPSLPMTPAGVTEGVSAPYSKLQTPHEAPRSSPESANQKEPSIIKTIEQMYYSAKRSRKDREAAWQTYWDFYEGKQWPTKRPSTKASPNCNIIRSTIATIAPILTDTSPSFGIIAKDPEDFKFAELLTDVVKVWWDQRLMNHTLVECLMDSLITDVGILKVTWNDDLNDGLGDADVNVVDPRNLYVNENCIDFDKRCDYVIHEFFKRRGELALTFPKFTKEITNASLYNKTTESSDTDTRVRVVSPVNQDVAAPDNGVAGMQANEEVRVWECWIRDDTIIEQEEINRNDEECKEPKKVLKKKYPHGRVVTLLPDSKVVVQDVVNPYKDGEFPFVKINDMIRPRSFYGDGEVVVLMETQRMINKAFAVIMDWCNLMSNPTWILDDDSGVDPDMITSGVGQIIVKKHGSDVRREAAPPVPPQLFEMYHTLTSLADTQSGVHDVTQGRKPAGITAAQAIETLQEAAQTRIRLKERNLTTSLVRLGRLIVSRMLQYYTEPRVIRLTGRNDLRDVWPPYVKFFVEQNESELGTEYRPVTQEIKYDEETGAYAEGTSVEGRPTMGDFELQVTSGASLPYIKEQRTQQAMRLWESKAIDQQALLDVLDFPEKDQILQRMQEQEQTAAAAQQQQPQQPPMGA